MIWCRFEREGKVSHGRIVDDEVYRGRLQPHR